jgi:molybdate transport system ATP-binding protein
MGRDRRLKVPEWTLNPGELWVVIGGGGTGKSSLARCLAGVPDASGYVPRIPGLARYDEHEHSIEGAFISFDLEREIREELRRNDDSEWLGRPDEGTTLDGFLGSSAAGSFLDSELKRKLAGRGIRHLSTGEFRQVLIAREAGKKRPLAVLDEPFEGLDINARPRLTSQISQWKDQGTLIVLTVNRVEDIPDFTTGLVMLKNDEAAVIQPFKAGTASVVDELENAEVSSIPPSPVARESIPDVLIEISSLNLAYNGRQVLREVNWTVQSGESWLVTGPNGSGKTTLLNLISGDEPRGYGQNMRLFGRPKGTGESTAELKAMMGRVSADLQEKISKHDDVESVVGSGLRDSLVLYPPLDGYERHIVRQWLALLGLEGSMGVPFYRLPYGARRLALIARAMVKHPPLLLLDEPMQGLDERSIHHVSKLVDKVIRETDTAVIFVSHRPEDAPDSIRRHLRIVPGKGSGASGAVAEDRMAIT